MNFQTGRVTVEAGDAACDGEFPNAHGGYQETITFLKQFYSDPSLGLSDDEQTLRAVVLMGAHSLGQLYTENSGFLGPWDRNTTL